MPPGSAQVRGGDSPVATLRMSHVVWQRNLPSDPGPRHALTGKPEGTVPALAPHPDGPTSRKELEAFLDRFFARHMHSSRPDQKGPVGAAIAVVKDGKILLVRGYGYANVARGTPVRPNRTLFRICSVSKVVTATAALQLVEQGKLRLNEDVNRYLTRFKLPNTFPRPVTLANLLTHTGGFDELHIGRSTLSALGLRPLGSYLAERMPSRVLPPGEVYSYSDHGYALIGYLAEAVSGVPFARYVDQNIFRPLGMRHSSFQQTLPANLASQLATGYDIGGDGVAHAAPYEYFNTAPAAGMSATATDMARFMIAQLQGGRYATGRILRAATVRQMQREHYSSYPRRRGYPAMPGVAYGFGIGHQDGQRILDHSGALRGFTSLLTLLPEKRFGFFVAGTTAHDSYLFDLQRQFVDHYFGQAQDTAHTRPPPVFQAFVDRRNPISRFAGSYWSTEYSRHTVEKLRQLVNQVQVTARGNASLTAHFWDGRTVQLTRIGPLLFQTEGGGPVSYWAFVVSGPPSGGQDTSARITRMAPGGNEVFDRIEWYETTALQLDFIGALSLIFLSGSVVWLILPPVRLLYRRVRGRSSRSNRPGRIAMLGRWLGGVTCALDLFFLVTFLLLMQSAASTQDLHYSWIEYGVPAGVIALLCIPLVTTALAVTMPFVTILAWKGSYWSVPARLHYTLLSLGTLAFIPFLLYWNLLGFHF